MSLPPLPDQPPGEESPGRRPQSDHGDVRQPSQPVDGPEGPNVSGGGGNSKVIAVICAVGAAVAICAVGFFLINGDEGAEGKSDEKSRSENAGKQGKELFKIKVPRVTDGPEDMAVVGSWVTDDIYAKGIGNAIVGMDPADGKQKWKLPLDGLACSASEHISTSGKAAVVIGESKSSTSCSRLVVFDVNSGEKQWQKRIPNGDESSSYPTDVTVSQEVVAATWRYGSVAYKASGGSPLWKTDLSGENDCTNEDFAGGRELTAIVDCGDGLENDLRARKLDAKTGKPTWEFKIPGNVEDGQVVSSDPMAVAVDADIGIDVHTAVMVVGENHKLTTISLDEEKYKYNPCVLYIESCPNAVIDDKFLYVATLTDADGDDSQNEIIAFDLSTGERKWQSGAGKLRVIVPLRMEGGKLIAYKMPTADAGGEVVAIDPAKEGKKQEIQLRNPDDSKEFESTFVRPREAPVLYENGRLYLQQGTLPNNNRDPYVSAVFGPE